MDEQQPTDEKSSLNPASRGEKIAIVVFSLLVIAGSLYFALRNNAIPDSELSEIRVTLTDTPRYDIYKVKSTTYRNIILDTKEYDKEFKITGMTFLATDHRAFKAAVTKGDTIGLRVEKGHYDEVYGLSKNGVSYIDLRLRTELKNKDSKYAYLFIFFGLVMLPYGFMKKRPLIGVDYAIGIAAAIIVIVMLVITRC